MDGGLFTESSGWFTGKMKKVMDCMEHGDIYQQKQWDKL